MQLWLQLAALVLMLLSMPLISVGASEDIPALWWLGLVLITLGGLIPPSLRYAPLGSGEGGEQEE